MLTRRALRHLCARRVLWAWVLLAALPAAAPAVDTQAPLPTAALQSRYETLTHELRCLVCQDEDIADSSASLAAEVRSLVHEQLLAGRSDAQIKAYMVSRYGDFVLLKPPVTPLTWLLWSGPFLLILAGAALATRAVRRRARLPDALLPLQESEAE